MSRETKDSGIEWVGRIPVEWDVRRNKYNFELDKRIIGNRCEKTQLLSLTKYGIKAINEEEQTGKVPTSFTTYQVVDKDDLVMCLFDLDVSAVFSGISPYAGMISPAYKCLKCKSHIHPQYADYYFRTVFVDRKYKRYSKNVRYSLSSDEFMALPIVVPPVSEQHRIVNFLDSKCSQIDEISKKIQEEIDTLEEYKKSVITEAVTKGLDPKAEMKDSGIEWIGKIPKSWELYRIKQVTTNDGNGIKIGPFGSSLSNRIIDDGEFKVYGQANLVSGDFSWTKNTVNENTFNDLKAYEVIPGDICVSMMGTIGKCRIVPEGITRGIMDSHLIKIRLNQDIILSHYFEYVYDKDNSHICFTQMQYDKKGSIMDGLNTSIVKNLIVPIPEKEEQKSILLYLNNKCCTIDDSIKAKRQQLSTLEEYKKSLIYEYVTGKKEVA